MRVPFSKMHGLGNDFVVIDNTLRAVALSEDQVRWLCDRRLGVGCDQLLLVETADTPGYDFRYRIFNADGSEVEQCGNGARCFAQFVREQGLTDKTHIHVQTLGGPMGLEVQPDGQVQVAMGEPRLDPAEIPFQAERRAERYCLELNGDSVEVGVVSLGNPHAVLQVGDVRAAPVMGLGPKIEHHPRFPNRANVGFMEVVDHRHLRLRVYERGVGETLACGSGACAAVVVARLQGLVDRTVTVDLPGGRLVVSWAGPGSTVYLTGPATTVFEGIIDL